MEEFLGETRVHAEVFERIAFETAERVPGVERVIEGGGLFAQMSERLRKGLRANQAEPAESEAPEGKVFNIKLELKAGSVIPQVARRVQETVKEAIERMTNQKVTAVNVFVEGFTKPSEQNSLGNLLRRPVIDEDDER